MLLKMENPETRDLILLYSIAKEISQGKIFSDFILQLLDTSSYCKTISQKLRICPTLEVCFKVTLHLTGLSFVNNLISSNH